jgi:tight adherence protein C
MPLLLAFLLFCAFGLILLGLLLPLTARDPVAARLAQFAERPRTLEELELEQPFSERVIQPIIRKLAAYAERLTRRDTGRAQQRRNERIERTRKRLVLAGNPYRWTVSDWLGVKLFAALVGAGLGAVFVLLVADPALLLLGALIGGAVGFVVPEFWLSRMIAARQKEIVRALPDVLDLLTISVEAGLGFDAALARVVAKSDNALTQELNRVMAEMRVGRPRREALRDMVARTEVPDLANFVSALIQAEQLGVSVSQVLHVQAEHLRVVRRQRAEEQAQKAPLKMLFPMLIFIFPALCIIILGPLWPAVVSMRWGG